MTEDQTTLDLALLVAALFLVLMVGLLVVFALLRAGRYPPSVGLVISLSLLSVVSIVGFMATQNEVLGTIAATGVGALAGAVSAVWTDRRTEDQWKAQETPPGEETPDE